MRSRRVVRAVAALALVAGCAASVVAAAPGGPLDAQLQHSVGDGWRAVSVDGAPIPAHEVSPAAATIGTPMVMRDGSLLVPVTRHDASRSSVVLYSTTDGRHFTRRASAPVDAALGAGVAVPTATPDGYRVLVLDPAGTATSWSPQGTTRFRTAGLPSGAAAVQLGSGGAGQAVVTTGTCSRGKTDCTVRDRVYRTTDGGRSWAG